jgi:uncharacterized membrane protein
MKNKLRKAVVKAVTRAAVIINPLAVYLMMAQSRQASPYLAVVVTAASVWIWIVLRSNVPEI